MMLFDYAENLTFVTSSSATPTDVPGLSIDVTTTTAPIEIEFCFATWSGSNATGVFILELVENSTVLHSATAKTISANAVMLGGTITATIFPTAGTHTYRLRLYRSAGAGTITIYGDATFPFSLKAKAT